MTLHLGAKAKALVEKKGTAVLAVEAKDGTTMELPADKILVTVGRKPNTEGWGLENMAVDMAGRFVKVDDQCRTSMKDVWAIGDLVGEPMLAHKASAQGEMVAEIIAGHKRRFDPVTIAAVCFTEPEIVSAGLLPDEAAQERRDRGAVSVRRQRPRAQHGCGEKAVCARAGARRRSSRAGHPGRRRSMSRNCPAEFAHALEMGATLEDIAGTIHVHPTLSEAFHESALRALGHAIHI